MNPEESFSGETSPETFEFGERNLSASRLSLGRIVESFPWTEYFNALGIEGQYPTILYQSDKAEAEFEELSEQLASWIIDTNAWYAFDLYFGKVYTQPEGDRREEIKMIEEHPTGRLQIELHLPEPNDEKEIEHRPLIEDMLCLAIARHHASEEAHGHKVQIERIGSRLFWLS
ncbi:hypothetical protein [Porphyromonas crevioricanis]|uniref:Uncharacterized protein n=2 Tax=Porphyromonas crevioricanis TaxID=393921 RepID=A0A2X4PGP4_9PORP|nr:hypothetical protein [Porphyromonas crevioricanis]GAD05134.1 hypothetical protein PORCRE_834 [Porphyromonas crevioricanis JCM 15906]GAD07087.1 hypothetical protein PORCAN_704 [Porphyromonas crevioricanis JCM 13913]SJZ84460.1 hypothetical protein SAMN02745203_01041 [Porphyromonas crevioricanis]SQH73064.1 Uncharacterised protein [Porphyromonas crevioricanis]